MIVDAHVHLWDVAAVPISWYRDGMGLQRRVVAADLARAVAGPSGVGGFDRLNHRWLSLSKPPGAAGAQPADRRTSNPLTPPAAVHAAIAVQAADTAAEARWLLAQAAAHDPLPGSVVLQYAADPDHPGSWAGTAQEVLDESPARVAGIRLAVPSSAPDLSDVVGLDALCEGLSATGRVLETLVRPDQLPAVGALAARHPDLSVVVCHLGLGTGPQDAAWRGAWRELARLENVHAKLSGIHTGAADDADRVAEIARVAVRLLGPDRLMFGSDWPMSARVAPYGEIVDRTARALPALDEAGRAAVWSGTAARLYGVALP